MDKDRIEKTSPDDIRDIGTNFFNKLFSSSKLADLDNVLQHVQPKVNVGMNTSLTAPYSAEEVREVVFQMLPSNAPGPNGLNPFFYQHFWDIVGEDVTKATLEILEGAGLTPSFNHTNVALISKKPGPTNMSDFQPISLCNVI